MPTQVKIGMSKGDKYPSITSVLMSINLLFFTQSISERDTLPPVHSQLTIDHSPQITSSHTTEKTDLIVVVSLFLFGD